jgi:hypothetical protein
VLLVPREQRRPLGRAARVPPISTPAQPAADARQPRAGPRALPARRERREAPQMAMSTAATNGTVAPGSREDAETSGIWQRKAPVPSCNRPSQR